MPKINIVTKNRTHANNKAFTLIEIMVMLAVLATLLAITYLGFGAWRTKIAETEVKNDINGVISGMENIRNFNDGYPDVGDNTEFDGTGFTKNIFSPSKNVKITYVSGDKKGYCVDVQSKEVPSVVYFYDSTAGTGTGATAKKGTCLGGEGATPPPITTPEDTVFVFNTNATGCTGTVQLPVSSPTSGGTINWGDGNTESLSSSLQSHTYSKPGTYTVAYRGPISQADYEYAVNTTNAKCLTRVNQWANNISPTKVSFYRASNLVYVAEPPHTVTSMRGIFNGATYFNQDISAWNVSNVMDMGYMFANAQAFNQPIGGWNVSGAWYMNSMFENADSFNQPIGSWNVSNAMDMFSMFQDNDTFNQPIGSWNVSKVERMTLMFRGASAFNQPIGSWNVSNVTDMGSMFNSASSFNQPLNNWDTSNVTNFNVMFAAASSFNQPLNNWNTAKVTNMYGMFSEATSFNQPLPRSGNKWNTSKVTTMEGMFASASSFNQNISGWTVTAVTNWNDFRTGSPLTNANTPSKFR